MQPAFSKTRLSLTMAGLLALASPLSAAEIQCKQMAETECMAQPACSWVGGYVRKDGREVSAYCRNAPVKRQQPQSTTGLPQAMEKAVEG